MIEGRQEGPFTLEELAAAGVRPDTYVWCKDYDDWQQAREDGEICRYFRRRLFDRMHPQAAVPVAEPLQGDRAAQGSRGSYRGKGRQEAAPLTPEEEEYFRKLEKVPPRFRGPLMNSQTEFDWPDPDAPEDVSQEPSTWYPFPLLLSVLFFFPLGLWAVFQARKSRHEWAKGNNALAHELARRGKIAGGLAVSAGLILIAVLIRSLTA